MDTMRFLAKLLVAVVANAIGLLAAAYLIAGFSLPGDPKQIAVIAIALTGLNFVLKPILRLILGPIIFLTLGLGIVLVNAAVLYVLTILTPALTISGIQAYLLSALIVGAVNFVFHLGTK